MIIILHKSQLFSEPYLLLEFRFVLTVYFCGSIVSSFLIPLSHSFPNIILKWASVKSNRPPKFHFAPTYCFYFPTPSLNFGHSRLRLCFSDSSFMLILTLFNLIIVPKAQLEKIIQRLTLLFALEALYPFSAENGIFCEVDDRESCHP